jgi:hypothetical protein
MTTPALPPEIARELAVMRRQIHDLQRQRRDPALHLASMADVDMGLPGDGQIMVYRRSSGQWEPGEWDVGGRVLRHSAITRAPAGVSLTTSFVTVASIPGFNTVAPDSVVLVDIVCDFAVAATGGDIFIARATIGGTAIDGAQALAHDQAARITTSQHYRVVVAAPSGLHIIALEARKLTNAGSVEASAIHSSIRVSVYG